MKIAYYIHYTAIKSGGIFTYSLGVLNLLLQTDKVDQVLLVYSSEQTEYLQKYFDNPKLKPLLVDRNSKLNNIGLMISYFLYDTYFIYKKYVKNPNKLVFLKRLAKYFNPYKKVKKAGADIFHVPMQFSPAYSIGVPVVITMHDVQELHFPEYFDSAERMHRAINSKKAVEEAEHTIVSFGHVKNDLMKYYGLSDKQISVCMPPVAEDWFKVKNITPFAELQIKYSIPENFILLPAATWKHKNHLAILKAIKQLKESDTEIFFVSTGNKTEYYTELEKYITENNLQNNVLFTGIIPEEDLLGLFKTTRAVVIPTLYEAGSGPMFESFKYGTHVISSNVTSLPESMDNDKFIFDPHDISDIAEKIKLIANDDEYRKDNLTNAERRIEEFRKIDFAASFLEVYEKLALKQE